MEFSDCLNMTSMNVENRQSLNLSKTSMDILNKDKDMLESNSGNGYSSIINHIFQSFYDEAEASVPIACERERDRLREIIGTDDPDGNLTSKLVENYKKRLEQRIDERIDQKGHRVLIRFNQETLNILAAKDGGQKIASFYADKYNGKVGKYMKALVEEYCELPYTEREKVYFHSTILQPVRDAIEGNRILRLTLHSNSGLTENILYLKPYAPKPILTDSENQYNYLVGMRKLSDPAGSPKTVSVRLTSIKECRVQGRVGSGSLAKKELTEISSAISDYGVQYLSNNNIIDLTVQFAPEGERLYKRSIFHLRPTYDADASDPANRIYKFRCPRSQALFYFFRFGEDVKIIEPADLAEEFRTKYIRAAEQYPRQS